MRKSARKKAIFVSLLLAAVLVGGFFLFRSNVTPAVIAISESTIKSMTTVAVNEAVYDTLNDRVRYEDLVSVLRDENGDVQAFVANSPEINRIARDTAYNSQKNLADIGEQGVMIPLGTLTGSPVLAGFGPDIRIKIIPIGNVRCEFRSEFESQGINQTRHAIYLDVIADVDLIMPAASTTIASRTEILICDSLIVGKVPDTYLDADIFGGGFDLVPDKSLTAAAK